MLLYTRITLWGDIYLYLYLYHRLFLLVSMHVSTGISKLSVKPFSKITVKRYACSSNL